MNNIPSRIRLYGLAASAAVLLVLPGCDLARMLKKAKDQTVTVVPTTLELHGDSVAFDVQVSLPTKMLKPNKIYALSPNYMYGDQRLILGEIVFKGNDYPMSDEKEPKSAKRFSFPYKGSAMDRGDLVFVGIASNIGGKQKQTTDISFGNKGVITTSRLVRDVFYASYADHGYNDQEEFTPSTVKFYFEQGQDKLRDVEIKGDRGKLLGAFIAAKNPTRTVIITGSHSPEGREVRNYALSEGRAKAIEKFYRDLMKKYTYKLKADSIKFVTRSLVQDWKPFKDSLVKYNGLTTEQKAQVFTIIDGSTADFATTELELAKLPFYNQLLNEVYPKLRTANTEILDLKAKKTEAQISIYANEIVEGKRDIASLNEAEFFFAAAKTPVLDEKKRLYQSATKLRNSWKAHNNLAAVYIEQAMKLSGTDRIALADKAITSLEIAKGLKEEPTVLANLSAAYLLKGNTAKAAENISRAGQLRPDDVTRRNINSMKGALLIRLGKYPAAVAALAEGNSQDLVSYNRGLANLLAKNYDAAQSALEEALAVNPNLAVAQYALAVTGARKKDEALMERGLKAAIKLDDNLRARAVNDLEFMNYFGADNFKNAIK
jgi:tetratricopeptide (TPR) repeat protein